MGNLGKRPEEKAIAEKFRKMLESKLAEKEVETLEYWSEEIRNVIRKAKDLAGLKAQMETLVMRMAKRTEVLRKELARKSYFT